MAPSKEVNDVLGAIGGGLLACMMAPQLLKLYKTKRANDLSLIFLVLYLIGTVLLFVYLYFEDATVAWISLLVEIGLLVLTTAAKIYLDNFGPYSPRGALYKGGDEAPHPAGSRAHLTDGVTRPSDAPSARGLSIEGELACDAERGANGNGLAAATDGVRLRSQHS